MEDPNNTRETAIKINEEMRRLHQELNITDKFVEINVGTEPGDCTGDTYVQALHKIIMNLCNLFEAIDAGLTELKYRRDI